MASGVTVGVAVIVAAHGVGILMVLEAVEALSEVGVVVIVAGGVVRPPIDNLAGGDLPPMAPQTALETIDPELTTRAMVIVCCSTHLDPAVCLSTFKETNSVLCDRLPYRWTWWTKRWRWRKCFVQSATHPTPTLSSYLLPT